MKEGGTKRVCSSYKCSGGVGRGVYLDAERFDREAGLGQTQQCEQPHHDRFCLAYRMFLVRGLC
jgi:hypothetical protein